MSKKKSARKYIALLEKRGEESRRTIGMLASMLASAMDRIEYLEQQVRMRSSSASLQDSLPWRASNGGSAESPVFLDSADVAELLGVPKLPEFKLMKAIKVGNRWKISEAGIDEFVSNERHLDSG